MKVWGLMLCFVLVATVACVVAAPERVLPLEEELVTGESIDLRIAPRACTQPWCNDACRRCFGCGRGLCTATNTCTCYC